MSKNVSEALRIIGSALMLHKEDRDRLDAAIAAVEAERVSVRDATTDTAKPPASRRKKK